MPGTFLLKLLGRWRCLVLGGVTGLLAGVAGAQVAATSVVLLRPSSVAVDAAGNLYVAETNRHDVVRIDVTGGLTVVAGSGVQGFSGDGGLATAAELDSPAGVAVGGGNIYIADTHNQRVRRVDGAGVITTIAGTGARGFGGDGGAAAGAVLDRPGALCVDGAGAVYVADAGNHRVRRISGGVIATVAGDGVQGFSGDGGPAVAAELDSPGGLVAAAGGLYIADTRNQRIRVVDSTGVIRTVAGNGLVGGGGDGGAAVAAALAMPRGLSVDAAGNVVFADSGNQRVRAVSAAGVMSTVAGSGVQGSSAEGAVAGAASLNTPWAALTAASATVVADTGNGRVSLVAANGELYTAAGGGGLAAAVVSLTAPGQVMYGGGSAVATVQGGAPAGGTVTLMDGGVAVSSAAVGAGTAMFSLGPLDAGAHTLTARYSGDVLHAGAVSNSMAVTVIPLTVTATAAPVSVVYGAAVPVPTGTFAGELAGDASRLQVSFSTAAAAGSAAGVYPIVASLGGPAAGDYVLTMAAESGVVTISPAASVVTVSAPSSVYGGQSVALSASVASVTTGAPSGSVSFMDGGVALGSATLVSGTASLTVASLAMGAHTITAVYGGDADFHGGTSTALNESVLAVPDFSVSSSGASSASVTAGSAATFSLMVSPQAGAFTGPVQLSATGLPPGAIASFTPVVVVPGASPASVTLTVQTAVGHAALQGQEALFALAVMLMPWMMRRRMRGVACALLLGVCFVLAGCGARTVSSSTAATGGTYSITVTGSGVSVTNALLQHSVNVSLAVR